MALRGRDILKDEVKYWCKSLIPIKHIDLTIGNGNCVCVCINMFLLWFTTLGPKAQQALCWLITAQDLTSRAIEWHHHQSGLSHSITTHHTPSQTHQPTHTHTALFCISWSSLWSVIMCVSVNLESRTLRVKDVCIHVYTCACVRGRVCRGSPWMLRLNIWSAVRSRTLLLINICLLTGCLSSWLAV